MERSRLHPSQAIRSITSLSSVARAPSLGRTTGFRPSSAGSPSLLRVVVAPLPYLPQGGPWANALVVVLVFSFELEQVKQVADGRRIHRGVSILPLYRVRQVVAAAAADRRQVPVPFDELQDRNMVCVFVRNVARPGVGRNHDHRNARPVPEEIKGLRESGIVITTAFIRGNENGRTRPELRIRLHRVHYLLDEAFIKVPLRGSRMTVHPAARLHEGDRRQSSIGDIVVKIRGVLKVRVTNLLVGHDLSLILETVANVAVLIAGGANGAVVELVLVAEILVPLVAIGFPGHAIFQQNVADAALPGWRDCERSVVGITIGVGVAAVAKIAWIVVVEKIVVPGIAIWLDRPRQRLEVVQDRRNSRLC